MFTDAQLWRQPDRNLRSEAASCSCGSVLADLLSMMLL